ncbi:MAG TPA: flavodoxin domain-containing protein [Candidatus Limnocylindrales bacterium]|nr:flavodoxin domain-containing protein [Candidatus Limnocylindrales bacterium]
MARILVAYATKLGSTREIADVIGAELHSAGHAADVLAMNDVRSIDGYDAVVIGSALYAAHWQRDANRFVHRHVEGLNAARLWAFSSGPLDAKLAAQDLPMTPNAAEITAELRILGHRTFGGRLAADAPIDPQVLATHPIGDFRDWDRIRRWAREIALALDVVG